MEERSQIRVIVADDHPVVVKAMQCYFERERVFDIVATAFDTVTLASAVGVTPCDYVFLDIGMRGINGESNSISFLRGIAWKTERPKLIVVSMISQGHMLAGLIQMGVDGVIDKRDGLDCLSAAVAATSTGTRYLSPSAKRAVMSFPDTAPARAGVLSRREWEVFQLYASGLGIEEIATRFDRSSKTISTQKRSGMRKLGLKSDRELIAYMRQVGLL
jgi:two-component system, NarL family, captular synthesis response regulator RcsB